LIEELGRRRSPVLSCKDRTQVKSAARDCQYKNASAIALACSPCSLKNDGGPPHLANRRYRLLGLRIAFARRTTLDTKHTRPLGAYVSNAVANPYSTVA
jgi:hypothetical protein